MARNKIKTVTCGGKRFPIRKNADIKTHIAKTKLGIESEKNDYKLHDKMFFQFEKDGVLYKIESEITLVETSFIKKGDPSKWQEK